MPSDVEPAAVPAQRAIHAPAARAEAQPSSGTLPGN
jgi:hypothetical protein